MQLPAEAAHWLCQRVFQAALIMRRKRFQHARARGVCCCSNRYYNSLERLPAAPAQSFCSGNNPTIANLSAIGSNIVWYAASSGGSALATSTGLSSGTYYASQTVSTCERSSRFAVAVTVTTTPGTPTGSASQSFCSGNNPTVANLTATGSGILWYAASSGGSSLTTSTALSDNTHYYASQTVSGCESNSRLDVIIRLHPPQTFKAAVHHKHFV